MAAISNSISFKQELEELRKNVVQESVTRYVFNSLKQKNYAHVVDLLENKNAGECSCQHFQYRILPMIKQGLLSPHEEKSRCKHMRIARQMFFEAAIEAYSKQFQ